jgi:flagellar basal body rod protein FlgB
MAKNKDSSFGVIDNLDFGTTFNNTQEVTHDVAHKDTHETKVQQVHDVHEAVQEVKVEYGSTQGNRNGIKLKRINMAFSDANYDYITKESRRNGLSATAFVNKILDNHRK